MGPLGSLLSPSGILVAPYGLLWVPRFLWVLLGSLGMPFGPFGPLCATCGLLWSIWKPMVPFVPLLISFGPSGTLWTHSDSSWSLWPRLVTGLLSPFGASSYPLWGISLSLSPIYIYIRRASGPRRSEITDINPLFKRGLPPPIILPQGGPGTKSW